MENRLREIFGKMAMNSRSVLLDYIADKIESFRFFSYGSNMNEEKFREDMKEAGKEIGLINPKKRAPIPSTTHSMVSHHTWYRNCDRYCHVYFSYSWDYYDSTTRRRNL